jgi:hypothetical protein
MSKPIYHITRRVHQGPPLRDERDDTTGQWLGWVILFCAAMFGAAVWSVWK